MNIFRRFLCNSPKNIRNVAIIAHVDHGKTTLVDKLLQATNSVSGGQRDRMMDSGDIERERGITILSKCTSVVYKGCRLNLVDTPGHSDFGGEVERIMRMVDGVLLVVDVAEGPMAQTKFVLAKSLIKKLPSIVVLNKVDRAETRTEDAELEVIQLYEDLKAHKSLMDYPVCYSSSKHGWAVRDINEKRENMLPLLETILNYIPPPKVDISAPFTMLVSLLSHDQHLGRIITGRVNSGRMKPGQPLKILALDCKNRGTGKALKIMANRGLKQQPIPEAIAGDIVSLAGLSDATVTDTICDPKIQSALESDRIDPPTLEIQISVNSSPLQGKEGNKLTSTKIWERLEKEVRSNVAIEVKNLGDGVNFSVKGRGELQLGVLLETMRREGFELQISPPKVLMKRNDSGKLLEPMEKVTIEIDEKFSGSLIERMSYSKAEMVDMSTIESNGKSNLVFIVPSRMLIGFDSELKNLSRGTGVMNKEFHEYAEYKGKTTNNLKGRIISLNNGTTTNYSIANIESKGTLFIGSNTEVYGGMIIGESNSEKDLEVNPVKAKRLTNIRAAGNDENIRLLAPRKMPLEKAISYIQEDELVEITPNAIRLRKKILETSLRARNRKQTKSLHN